MLVEEYLSESVGILSPSVNLGVSVRVTFNPAPWKRGSSSSPRSLGRAPLGHRRPCLSTPLSGPARLNTPLTQNNLARRDRSPLTLLRADAASAQSRQASPPNRLLAFAVNPPSRRRGPEGVSSRATCKGWRVAGAKTGRG
ncbi:hypothetical protein ANANG_G00190340 [Anguilla anguilla]|uniref:Uncharacterized protein n=1 Tax=Anguilla anguilla TaxID=7936 RepID=A0A9D3M103_ANGAN|nr:hypothetical protein ANANG_G00190340 [Anguilla anguilla]